jgi:biotin transport system substrate-specific component
MPQTDTQTLAAVPQSSTGRRVVAVALGALVVAVAAQVRVPLPFTPVPVTLQDLAVLTVAGLLGPAAGVAALVTYLGMGLAGLPVFAGGGSTLAWLLGPTGGYLLAFPVAAFVMGTVSSRPGFARALLGAALGMAIVHIGGVAQLAILSGGDLAGAFRLGSLPFLPVSAIKVGLAAGLVTALASKRAWLR